MQTKLTLFGLFAHGKANHCLKFTKLKFEDTKYKHGQPYIGFWYACCLDNCMETSSEVMEVDK